MTKHSKSKNNTLPLAVLAQNGDSGNPQPRLPDPFFDVDEVMPEARRERLEWLRKLLLDLFGGREDDLEQALGVASNTISFVALGQRMKIDRRTAKARYERHLGQLRQGWLRLLAEIGRRNLLQTGGATIAPWRLEPISKIRGYAWSLCGFERTYSKYPTLDQLVGYVTMVQSVLFRVRHAHFGLWFNPKSNQTHADVTMVHPNKAYALAQARKENQLAVTDLATLNTTWLDTPDESRRVA